MDKRQDKTGAATIGRYLHSQIRKHALWTGVSLLIVSIVVALLSMKFSTERLVRRTCADIKENSRILVETFSMPRYQTYHNEVIDRLSTRLEVKDLHVTKKKPESSWNHYQLDHCYLDWRSNFKVKFYAPTQWNDEEYFVRGTLKPKYFRSDLFLLMILLAFSLLVSYQFGTRKLLRRIEDNIAGPIEEVWHGLQTGSVPKNLELKEFQDLWSWSGCIGQSGNSRL
ncbi:MAG: hypothetical protein AB8G05_27235 [Oligoflexales bacterium]